MIDPSLLEFPETQPEQLKAQGDSETLRAFRDRFNELQENPPFPQFAELDGGEAFRSACQVTQDARQKLSEVQWRIEQFQKQNDTVKLGHAETWQKTCQKEFDAAMTECERCAAIVLDSLSTFLSDKCSTLTRLVQYTVLKQATPEVLAAWCDANENETDEIANSVAQDLKIALTKDGAIQAKELQLCLESGGARKGQYGRAMQIYRTLMTQECCQTNIVMKRLALAVALELAEPYQLFGEVGYTQPYRRFDHYATAYRNGELDPVMSRFNVWELRHVIDSDAPEESLTWGRESLRNYRPDIVRSVDNVDWRFCQIVRTDVAYGTPTWYKSPRSYDQILSGGGKCGPRAWYGRFSCKAFGIPTWGCKQPSHAAMARWTYSGWKPCLGGGLHKSWWEGQGGNDFVLETLARNACASEAEYSAKVDRLEWVALCLNEKRQPVKRDDKTEASTPWFTLSMMQRKRLIAANGDRKFQPTFGERLCDPAIPNKIRALVQAKPASDERDEVLTDGTIVIPVGTSCTSQQHAQRMLQYDGNGRMQVWLKNNGHVSYQINNDDQCSAEQTTTTCYQLSVVVCTVHRQDEVLLCNTTRLEIPYTMGHWQETSPVTIEVSSDNVVRLERVKASFGISLKEIRLVPHE